MDRGAATLALLYRDNLKKENIPLSPTHMQNLMSMTFGPALSAKGRPIQKPRLDRLTSAIDLIAKPTDYLDYTKRCIQQDVGLLTPKELESATAKIQELMKRVELPDSNPEAINELEQKALATYSRSIHYYAPVAVKWTEHLLEKANKEGRKVVFMARDGSVPYKIAKSMLKDEKYQQRYPNLKESDISYAYLSRKIVQDCKNKGVEGSELMQEYMTQLGLQKGDRCLFVDIGFTGSMIDGIRAMLAPQELDIDFEFLYSFSPKANGFVSQETREEVIEKVPDMEGIEKIKRVFHSINKRSIHWLEDTHQGVIKSPSHLVKHEGKIYPNTNLPGHRMTYLSQPEDYLLRKIGQIAATDILGKINPDEIDSEQAKGRLNEFLINIEKERLPLFISHFDTILQQQKNNEGEIAYGPAAKAMT